MWNATFKTGLTQTRGPFLESPQTLRAIFGCRNSFCTSRTERIEVVKLHIPFSFCFLKNISKEQLSRPSGRQFHKWLFGPEKFSGLSRNGPQATILGTTWYSAAQNTEDGTGTLRIDPIGTPTQVDSTSTLQAHTEDRNMRGTRWQLAVFGFSFCYVLRDRFSWERVWTGVILSGVCRHKFGLCSYTRRFHISPHCWPQKDPIEKEKTSYLIPNSQ